MLKVGVIGAGYLGKIHLRNLLEHNNCTLVGFYDINPIVQTNIANELKVQSFDSDEALIKNADAIIVAVPAQVQGQVIDKCIRYSKHVFAEKPLVHDLKIAKDLIMLADEAGVINQCGFVERFNPAYFAIQPLIDNPGFIETHRLAKYNPRGMDVSVVVDVMIHDLDILLHMVNSGIKKVQANGAKIIGQQVDIAMARIEFDNGTVANLTANRVSQHNMRKSRIFQKDAYLSADFLLKTAEKITLGSYDLNNPDEEALKTPEGQLFSLKIQDLQAPQHNAIFEEQKAFIDSIQNNKKSLVPFQEAYKALELAYKIEEKIKLSPRFF